MSLSNLSEKDRVIVAKARDFAQTKVAPCIEQWESDRAVPVDLLREGIGRYCQVV
ncbi:hypothetical protein RA2_04526 [Roseovarius sp. A-2]|uniref:hypothetical protein n=1 Tax=Roseovarius sp. A-2 TaxID=1570360 RepID=UPI0009D477BB|nr:hypothetical protein [Roseovarius sp. A-2]GAW37443.1 hypothetical protein RA2_04526 [Roseovarius sp. A-2]